MIAISPDLADPHLHLFLDDEEIDSLVGVTRLINQFRPRFPGAGAAARSALGNGAGRPPARPLRPGRRPLQVLVPGRDHQRSLPLSLRHRLRDLARWRHLGRSPPSTWYATRDGSPTNIVDLPRGTSARLLFPYLDMPGAAPGERFVATLYQAGGPRQRRGIYRAASPDGIHWTVSAEPIVRAGDRYAIAYDPVAPAVDADHPPGQRRRCATPAGGVPLGERRFPDVVLPGPPAASR